MLFPSWLTSRWLADYGYRIPHSLRGVKDRYIAITVFRTYSYQLL
jgi:hypothetical protein